MKKALISLLLLSAAAAAVFYFGWTSFAIPPGQFGVLITKTGGVHQTVIEPGNFTWNWERLLPTNSTLKVFALAPRSVSHTSAGVLPSGKLFAGGMEGNPDFSWNVSLTVTARLDPAKLPALLKDSGISDQNALDTWVDNRLKNLADEAVRRALNEAVNGSDTPGGALSEPASLALYLSKAAASESAGEMIGIETRVDSLSYPDTDLYRLAKQTYLAYLDEKTRQFTAAAVREAGSAAADRFTLDRYEQWGALLTKYPILIDFINLTDGNPAAALDKVKAPR